MSVINSAFLLAIVAMPIDGTDIDAKAYGY
jgi:hypothetical protein